MNFFEPRSIMEFFIGLKNALLMQLAAVVVGLLWIGFLFLIGYLP